MAILICDKCGTRNRVDEAMAAVREPVCGRCGRSLKTGATKSPLSWERPSAVSDATFSSDVLEGGNAPILLDCWAPWCGPCRMIAPILDQLAVESKGRYLIAKLNVDENPRTSAQFDIRSIPTLLIFKNGALVDRLVGAHPKKAIAAHLNKYA